MALVHTVRFLILEEAHQFDVLVKVEETFQLVPVVNDLHGVFKQLGRNDGKG